MPDSTSEIKNTLQEKLLESFVAEYKELTDTWRNLETKAQGSIAVAGIFILGTFGYLRDITELTSLYEKVFLTISIIFLLLSIIFSISALRIRKASSPPIGEYVDNLLQDLLEIEDNDEFLERIPRFMNDQILTWKNVNKEAINTNELKASHLLKAQLFLIVSVISISILVLIKIYK